MPYNKGVYSSEKSAWAVFSLPVTLCPLRLQPQELNRHGGMHGDADGPTIAFTRMKCASWIIISYIFTTHPKISEVVTLDDQADQTKSSKYATKNYFKILRLILQISYQNMLSGVFLVICLMISQHWFCWWFGAVRQQTHYDSQYW